MTTTGIPAAELSGMLRMTWVRDQLAHVLEHGDTDEPSGTWTGLACPGHGLETGTDVDNALRPLAHGDLADFTWEAPPTSPPSTPGSPSPRSALTSTATTQQASSSGSTPRPCGPAPGQPAPRHSASCKPPA